MSSKYLLLGFCLVVLLSAPLAGVGGWRIVGILGEQTQGWVAWTDFVNLYTGASLLARTPGQVYSPAAQQAFEQALTDPGHPYLGFFLPPPSAVLVTWLGWLPYSAAYAAWLGLGLACVAGAAWLLGQTLRGRLAWLAGLLLFLPVLEGLGQGQTSALLLLGMAGLARGLSSPSAVASGGSRAARQPEAVQTRSWLWLALLACLLKPQLGLVPLLALLLDRRFGTLLRAAAALAGLSLVGLLLAGPELLSSYRALSSDKLVDSLTAPPDFLPGPTLLHAMQRFFGTGMLADALGLCLAALVLVGVGWAWRGGVLPDDRRLLQVAVLPLASVLVAPYALIHEVSCWPVAFCLLERYTRQRPLARALLLVTAIGVWFTAELAVLEPNATRGADLAALLGLLLVVAIIRDLALTRRPTAAALRVPTIPAWPPVALGRRTR